MDLATLGISIQTSEVKSGAKDLDKLTDSAERAEGAVERLGKGSNEAAGQLEKINRPARMLPAVLEAQAKNFQAAGISAKQYAAALRSVPAQITDIVTSLAGGQNPFLVAIQQGGQLRDQFGGIGAALRALGTAVPPVGVALAALGVTIGVTVKNTLDAERLTTMFATAAATVARESGLATSQLSDLNGELKKLPGNADDATAALAALAGKVPTEKLAEFVQTSRLFARAADTSVADIVKSFQALEKDPTKALEAIQEKYKFVNAEAFKNVAALQRGGNLAAAAAAAQAEFARGLKEASGEIEGQRGKLQNLARSFSEFSVKGFSEKAIQLIYGIPLKEQTAEAELALRRRIRGNRELFSSAKEADQFADREERRLETLIELRDRETKAKVDGVKATDAVIEKEKTLTETQKAALAGADALSKARFGADLASIRRSLDSKLTAFAGSEAELDALRAAGLLKDEDFFKRKSELIDQSTVAQVTALRRQIAAITAENKAAQDAANESLKSLPVADRAPVENAAAVREVQFKQQILDLQARINELLAEGATRQKVLSTEAEGANRKLTNSLEDARQASIQLLASLDKQFERELQLQGAGNKARQQQAERDRLRDRFDSERRQIDREKLRDPRRGDELDKMRARIDQDEVQAFEKLEQQFDKLDERAASFGVGAREALNNYLDDVRDVAKQSEQLFTSAFNGIEDALVKFATTGKLSFKDLANSVIADLIRIQIRALIVQAVSGGLFGGVGGAIGGTGAGGGSVGGGGALFADVGIRRVPRDNQVAILHKDEAVIPARMNPFAGGKFPSGGERSSPTFNFNTTINAPPGTDAGALNQMLERRDQMLVQKIADGLRRGRFDGALQGAQR